MRKRIARVKLFKNNGFVVNGKRVGVSYYFVCQGDWPDPCKFLANQIKEEGLEGRLYFEEL